jgi:pteridine reductase
MELKKKAVFITGATKRLGLALTKQSLHMGFYVIAHYRTTAAPLKTWLKKHPTFQKMVFFLQADLADNPEGIIDRCLDLPAALIGLVNSASLFTPGNLDNIEHLHATLSINTDIPILLSHRFSQRVRTGWIINITDANLSLNKTFQNYRLSKNILGEVTRQQALLYAPKIRVNAIAPGAVLPPAHTDRTYFNRLKRIVPLKKSGGIQSLMQAYSFIIENTSVTGQILYIDNGLHLLNRNTSLQ